MVNKPVLIIYNYQKNLNIVNLYFVVANILNAKARGMITIQNRQFKIHIDRVLIFRLSSIN